MLTIVIAMTVILLLCGVVVVYVAFPHRGEDLPGAPWLGRAMRRGARSLPTVVPVEEAVPASVSSEDEPTSLDEALTEQADDPTSARAGDARR